MERECPADVASIFIALKATARQVDQPLALVARGGCAEFQNHQAASHHSTGLFFVALCVGASPLLLRFQKSEK